MPAIWLGGDGYAGNPANWSTGQVPHDGDTMVFDGSVSNADCVGGFGYTNSIHLAALSIGNGYSGHVNMYGSIRADDFSVDSGFYDDIHETVVYGSFTWTGGVLNSTTTPASIQLMPGSTARFDSGRGPLVTGDTLAFNAPDATSTLSGAVGTIADTVIQFVNNACLVVGTVNAAPPVGKEADLTLNGARFESLGGTMSLQVKAGGTARVHGGGLRAEKATLDISGGDFGVDGESTAEFTGRFPVVAPLTPCNAQMSDGRLSIQTGSTLDAPDGMKLTGGTLRTIMGPAGNPNKTAVILTRLLENAGARVSLNDDSAVSGKLQCVGDVLWTGGYMYHT